MFRYGFSSGFCFVFLFVVVGFFSCNSSTFCFKFDLLGRIYVGSIFANEEQKRVAHDVMYTDATCARHVHDLACGHVFVTLKRNEKKKIENKSTEKLLLVGTGVCCSCCLFLP